MKKSRLDIKMNWKNKKSIPVYLLLFYYLLVSLVFIIQDKPQEHVAQVAYFSLLWMGLTLLYMLEIKPVRDFFDKNGKGFRIGMLLITPITSFLIVEVMVSNFNQEMFEKYSVYNLVWYFIITFLIYVVLRNGRLTVIVTNFIIYLVAVINYLVYQFRGNPIIPSDLLAWRTGMSVASNYKISITGGFVIATLIMYSVFVVSSKFGNSKEKPSVVNRLAGIAIYSVFAVVVYVAFFRTDLIDANIRVIDYFAPKYTYCMYGTAFGFVANAEAMETEEPEGYSTDKVQELLEKSKSELDTTVTTQEKPNIIAIMNEAFSDLSMIGDYQTTLSYLPYTSTLEENTTKGTLYVSVFGGGTSDTEFEFLTGNSMAVMPQNSVPYQQFITGSTDSLAATLKEQGYYNIAIHPYIASGYKRDLVYPLLGFDEFLSREDFVAPKLIRSFISDRESYQKIIEEYETKGKDNPLFIFNVTMQNHGGYSGEKVFDENETVRLTNVEEDTKVEQYLSLLRETDKSFQTLVDYFSKEKEHTIILIFGDHQPVVFSKFHDELASQTGTSLSDIYQQKYMVPFILWANYDISEDDVDKISANYLSTYLLKTAGLKGTPYNQYLWQLHKEIPVINALFYITKDNVCHQFSTANAYSDMIKDYRYVGYNNALDKKGKLWEYYKLTQ